MLGLSQREESQVQWKSYGENPKSVSPSLGSVPGHDRHQDRITIANMLALAHKKWWWLHPTRTENKARISNPGQP